MTRFRPCALIGVMMLVLSGCTSSRSTIEAEGSLEGIRTLHATHGPAGSSPSAEQYQLARQRFVGSMNELLVRQERQARSPARRIKTGITTAGVVLGLGGTLASLLIDDQDTRAAIAQASSGVAGITGIISLVPFGSGSEKADAVHTYLTAEMPVFEARWPAEPDGALTPDEWLRFVEEAEHLTGLAELLSR